MQKTMLDEKILGKKVKLKKLSMELAETIFKYVDQDRERLGKFLPWVEFTKTIEDEIEYIQLSHEKWNDFSLYDFAIYETKSNTYLGNIGVHTIDWVNNACEIGYWILGKFEGKGFISDALEALEKELFKVGFNRIEIRCSSINERSANIPIANGYTLEGELKQNSIEMGKYRNTKIFAKLASSFIIEDH